MSIKEKLKKYINNNLEVRCEQAFFKASNYTACEEYSSDDIKTFINDNREDDTFQTKLFKYIDNLDLKDSDVYNKVNIDRRLFSKIRSDKNYHPSKETIILLALSLELSEEELEDLLSSASYSLPKNSTYDLIIRFCFHEKIYNINTVNDLLYDYNCNLLNT